MTEKEIIKECNELAKNEFRELANCWDEEYAKKAVQGLLDLYNKEKACNEELRKICYGKALEDLDTSHIYKQEQNTDI